MDMEVLLFVIRNMVANPNTPSPTSRELNFANQFVDINRVIRNCLDKTIHDNRKKEVTQSFLDGVLITQFISVAEASRGTGISKTYVSCYCKAKRKNSDGLKELP